MRTLLATLVVLSMASFAGATVTAVHDGGNPTVGLPGFTTYIVNLVSDNAQLPAGFNGSTPQGFNGPMNQVMAFGALPTPTLTNANLINPLTTVPPGQTIAMDSHFLLLDTDILAAVTPAETVTYLGGAFSIKLAARSNPLPLAQIVIQTGNTVVLTGTATDDLAAVNFPLNLIIPEPLTLSLLGVGALALIRRRR